MKNQTRPNNRKYYLLLSVPIAILIFWGATQNQTQLTQPHPVEIPATPPTAITVPTTPTPPSNPINSNSPASLGKTEKASVTAPASAPTSTGGKTIGWQLASGKAATPSIPLSGRITEYAAIEVARPENLPQTGEQVVFPMLNGETVTINVETFASNENGDYTWSGHLQGHGNDYPVTVTYGETSIFAMITTPKGSYSMESVNGSGWLYKNPSEAELTQHGTNDYLIPPIAE